MIIDFVFVVKCDWRADGNKWQCDHSGGPLLAGHVLAMRDRHELLRQTPIFHFRRPAFLKDSSVLPTRTAQVLIFADFNTANPLPFTHFVGIYPHFKKHCCRAQLAFQQQK